MTGDGDGRPGMLGRRRLLARERCVVLSGCALGLLFCAAALTKGWDRSSTSEFLIALGLRAWRSEITVAAIAVEWALGAWLLSGWQLQRALGVAVALLLGLTAVLGYAKATGAVADCGCFGRIVVSVDGALARNGVLLVVGALGLALRPRATFSSGGFT